MRKLDWTGAAILIAAALIGCGNDEPAGPEPEAITGLWNATRVEYVSRPAGSVVELVALGGSASLELAEPGGFTFTVMPSGEAPQTTTGAWQLDGDVLRLTPQGMPFSWEFDASLSAGELELTGASVEYDFDDDGSPEQATLNLALSR